MAERIHAKMKWATIVNLTREIAITDFKLRYHGSVLGYLWSLMKPFMLFSVLYVVFKILMRFTIPYYGLYLLLGIMLFNFFADATMSGSRSLLDKASLLTKVYFPRIIVVIASSLTALLTLCINLIVFSFFLLVSGDGISWTALLFPFYVILFYFFALGVALILSVITVKFRDVSHIWEVLLQLFYWSTPVIYSMDLIPEKYHRYIYLSPITRVMEHSRAVMIYHTLPDLRAAVVTVVMVAVTFGVGLLVFRKWSPGIVEDF